MLYALLGQALTPGSFWDGMFKVALVLVPANLAGIIGFGVWVVKNISVHDKRIAILETYRELMPSSAELSRKTDVESAFKHFEQRIELGEERMLKQLDIVGRKVDTIGNDLARMEGMLANEAGG